METSVTKAAVIFLVNDTLLHIDMTELQFLRLREELNNRLREMLLVALHRQNKIAGNDLLCNVCLALQRVQGHDADVPTCFALR